MSLPTRTTLFLPQGHVWTLVLTFSKEVQGFPALVCSAALMELSRTCRADCQVQAGPGFLGGAWSGIRDPGLDSLKQKHLPRPFLGIAQMQEGAFPGLTEPLLCPCFSAHTGPSTSRGVLSCTASHGPEAAAVTDRKSPGALSPASST